jgi:hypothetical protein
VQWPGERYLETELRGLDGSHVSTGAAANDYDIVLVWAREQGEYNGCVRQQGGVVPAAALK